MIKISIIKNHNLIEHISIKGHAEYDESGKDIVCSAVSSIAITTINGIMKIDHNCLVYQEEDGYIKIDIVKHSDVTDILINNMIDLLTELAHQYSQYIKINK